MNKIFLGLILAVAAYFRFYNNTAVALWHDEAFSALYIAKYGWGEMMHRIILDVHPPLYYLVLRVWSYVFGHSLLSLRGFSILLGLLTVWAGYLLVKQAFKNENWALVAALFLAINPFQIQYSLEARMYTLGTFLVLFSSYLLLKALEKPKFSLWLAYAITVAACAYTHYFLLFSLAAQGIFWFFYVLAKYKFSFLKAREFLMGAGSYILAGLLYVPWLPSFFEQRTRVASGYWIGKPDQWAVPGTIWKMTFGGQGTNHTVLAITSVIALMIIGYFIAKVRGSGKWLVFLSVFVPFAAALVMSYTTSIYQDRYFVFASLFFAILIALALLQIPRYSMKSVLVSVFVIITVVAFYKNWRDLDVKNLFTNREINNKPGMAKAASIVNEQSQPNDKIFVASSFVYFTFQYYYNGYNHTWNKNQDPKWPLLLSDIPLSQIPHFSGTAILSEEDLQPTTNGGLVPQNAVNKNSNAWVVWTTGFGGSKPNIPGNWSQVGEWEAPDTPGFKGSIFVTEYHVK